MHLQASEWVHQTHRGIPAERQPLTSHLGICLPREVTPNSHTANRWGSWQPRTGTLAQLPPTLSTSGDCSHLSWAFPQDLVPGPYLHPGQGPQNRPPRAMPGLALLELYTHSAQSTEVQVTLGFQPEETPRAVSLHHCTSECPLHSVTLFSVSLEPHHSPGH